MPDETEPVAPEHAGPSRRALLKGVAFGAGAAWVVPTILTIDATHASASAAGCLDCGTNVIPIADGNGSSLATWSNVTLLGSGVLFGNVFRAVTTLPGTANRIRNFSTDCTNRFGTQTPVNITLAANLKGGELATTSVTATFFSGTGGTGTQLATLTISAPINTTTAASQAIAIPSTTRSVRIAMSAGGGNGVGGGNKGSIDNVTLTLGTC